MSNYRTIGGCTVYLNNTNFSAPPHMNAFPTTPIQMGQEYTTELGKMLKEPVMRYGFVHYGFGPTPASRYADGTLPKTKQQLRTIKTRMGWVRKKQHKAEQCIVSLGTVIQGYRAAPPQHNTDKFYACQRVARYMSDVEKSFHALDREWVRALEAFLWLLHTKD